MRDALKRLHAAKLAEEEATVKATTSPSTPAPAKAVTPPTPTKHWGSRDYPHPVRAAKAAPAAPKQRHVVSKPGFASYEK